MVTAGAQSIPNLLPNTQELLLSESRASLSQSRHPHSSPCPFPGGFKTKAGSTPGGHTLTMHLH
jgi:hypothetical protein